MNQKTKKQLITVIILFVLVGSSSIGVFIYAVPSENQVQTDWRALLSIRISNEEYPIPAGIGYTNTSRAKFFTINTDNIIYKTGTDDAKLVEFFNIWNETFNSTCIISYCNTNTSTIRMYVNNVESYLYENYVIKNGDFIIIDYR